MPNLYSTSISNGLAKLEELDMNVYTIGDGLHIIGQYPEEGKDIYTGQRVFLLSDGKRISVPDFTGWTRKEVINYWNLSRIPIVLDGYGVAYEQSIPQGTTVDSNTEIRISFKDINYQEKPVEEATENKIDAQNE